MSISYDNSANFASQTFPSMHAIIDQITHLMGCYCIISCLTDCRNSMRSAQCWSHLYVVFYCIQGAVKYKKAQLSQRRPRDAPNIWVPWKISRVLTTPTATFPEICNGVLFRSKFEVCSFTPSWDNRGYSGLSCEPPILGKGRSYGVRDGTVRKSVYDFL